MRCRSLAIDRETDDYQSESQALHNSMPRAYFIYYLYLMPRRWGIGRCPPLDESIKVKEEPESKPLITRDEFDANLWSTTPFILLFSPGAV